jgi:ATP-dependent DNA ligase
MTRRTGIMLAKPYEERYVQRWLRDSNGFYIQPKLNGRRARTVISADHYFLISSEANTLPSCRHIEEQLDAAFEDFPSRPRFDGELFVHGYKIQTLGSLISPRVNLRVESQLIEFHIFDLYDLTIKQSDRIGILDILRDRLHKQPSLKVVETHVAKLNDLEQWLHRFMASGYEGIILRNPSALYTPTRTANMLKLKPRFQDSYRITGVFEAIDKFGYPKNMLGGLMLKGKNGERFNCGAGIFSHEERKIVWETWNKNPDLLKGKFAVLKYQELSERGVPLQPILTTIEDFSIEEP